MDKTADSILEILYGVRDNKLSTSLARERITQLAHADPNVIESGSDGIIALDILYDAANAYLDLLDHHSGESPFQLNPASESIKKKALRV
jgi:hypothetical protein